MRNGKFIVDLSPSGIVSSLVFTKDSHEMNWVVSEDYLREMNYFEENKDKLFGSFTIVANGNKISSNALIPTISEEDNKAIVLYSYKKILDIVFTYDLSKSEHLIWEIELVNRSKKEIFISEFGVWISLTYVMYRINNLSLQTDHSTAVFPSISKNFTKIACVRRSNTAPHLGIFQLAGESQSVGTYCCYENLFFENASPSLDGILFHKLMLAGGYPEEFESSDWIYPRNGFILKSKSKSWKKIRVL